MAMTTSRKLEVGLVAVVALVVIVGGVFALTNKKDDKKTDANATSQTADEQADDAHEEDGATTPTTGVPATDESAQQAAATITYSDSGFSPAETTIKSGETILIKNTSSEQLSFASGPHPVHTSNAELNVGSVAPGESTTVTLTTKGNFSVHNHLNPGRTTKINVE
jgi:plastocyanin